MNKWNPQVGKNICNIISSFEKDEREKLKILMNKLILYYIFIDEICQDYIFILTAVE